MATMRDVANLARVSPTTVSRVINAPGVVDRQTRAAVEDAIRTLEYRPNAMARSLASRTSNTIGIVINCFGSPYYGAMLDGVEAALSERGFKAVVESSRETAEGERRAWLSLMERQCDGLVIHSNMLPDEELVDGMRRYPKTVLMNRLLPGLEDRCIHLDNVRGGALAAQHLLDQGHRDIALVSGPSGYHEARHRTAGFARTMEEAGCPLSPALHIRSTFTEEGGIAAMCDLLARDRPFSAIFFENDEMAAGALEVCREVGLSVPGDLSVMGFDDMNVARYLTPKLTTIAQPLPEIGAAAGRLAHALATGECETDRIPRIFEVELMARASVAPFVPKQEE